MPITIRTNELNARSGETGEFVGIDAVTDKTTEQRVAEITAASNAEQTKIQQKGAAVLDSLPDEYTELAGEVDDLKSALEQAIDDFAVPTQEAVDNWLNEHPEATTTVVDNSVTKAKLATDVLGKYTLIPDNYSGTDTEKLQACLDALATTGGTIAINREYTLADNLVCSLDTSSNNHIAIVGLGENATIKMGAYSFTGTIDDLTGGLWFYNIKLQGTGTAFKCAKLIRLKFTQCYFVGFDKVFEDGNANSSQILQTIYLDQCYARNLVTAMFYAGTNAVFDIHVTNTTMEAGGTFFISTGSDYIASLIAENNCFEGLTKIFKASANQRIFQCVFDNNHCEQNTAYFDLSECVYIANMSICNNFFGEQSKKPLISLPSAVAIGSTTGALTVKGNTLADYTAQAYLFGLPNSPVKGNYTAINHENNRLNYLTDSNTYNAYLPYKTFRKLELTYTGANFDAFVTAMATDLLSNQPLGSENYDVMWSGNNWYSVTFTKISDSIALIYIFNYNNAYIIRFSSGNIANKNEIPFVSALSNYMPVGTASDADLAKTTGVYAIGTALYLVMRLDSGFISQLRFKYNTDYIEYRSCIGGTWQNWYRLTGAAVT